MSPTTREVEAARVERMRRQTEQAAPPPSPKSAQGRKAARAEAAHAAATARNAYRCMVEECPQYGVWQVPPVDVRDSAVKASRAHYLREHYVRPDTPAR